MYVHTCVSTYTHTHMHMYTHIHTYICIHVHTRTHIQTHTHSCPSGFTSSTVTCIAEPLTLSAGDSKSPNLNQRISFSFLYDTHFYFISRHRRRVMQGAASSWGTYYQSWSSETRVQVFLLIQPSHPGLDEKPSQQQHLSPLTLLPELMSLLLHLGGESSPPAPFCALRKRKSIT